MATGAAPSQQNRPGLMAVFGRVSNPDPVDTAQRMKKQGTVVKWNSEKSFGFIRSPDTPTDIFFHRSDYSENRSPVEGLAVTFQEIHVGGKGPRALSVTPALNPILTTAATPREDGAAALLPRSARPAAGPRATPAHIQNQQNRRYWSVLALMGVWLLLWLVGIGTGRFPWVILTAVALLNLATFYVYWRDKAAAMQDQWRASENQLHTLSLLGGWPGAWFAQQILRHKSSKRAFQQLYWATVALHLLGLLTWLAWPLLRAG